MAPLKFGPIINTLHGLFMDSEIMVVITLSVRVTTVGIEMVIGETTS